MSHRPKNSRVSQFQSQGISANTIIGVKIHTLGLCSAEVTLKRPLRSTTAPSDASSPKDGNLTYLKQMNTIN